MIWKPSVLRVFAGALPSFLPALFSSAVLLLCSMLAMSAQAIDWPQEITAPEGVIVIYQPQPESLKGNVLTGRAAMALELTDEKNPKKKKEPIFGAFWFTATIDTDDDDSAIIRDINVTQVRWPDSNASGTERFSKIVENAVPTSGFTISKAQLSASLASAALEQKSLAELKTDPPKIVFKEELAVLLLYDGEPKFAAVENSEFERALNTPFAVARDNKSKALYLSSGTAWYQAQSPLGPWAVTNSPPAELVKKMQAASNSDGAAPAASAGGAKIPSIVVATEPTELIATDGKPTWKSLTGGKLLYVENTETPWLRELSSGKMFILLSGRWFSAASTAGPWAFVRPDQLPASFKDIPPESEIGGLRLSVAGTDEANDAMLDAQIPQTAAIKRSEAKLSVSYDGAPKFEKIPGTQVSYAVNTGAQVLLVNNYYYAVDNGVWFSSAAATGPWIVADKIPEAEIQKIPASSPVYNTTYVTVYQSTPEVVYVGYTPGYMWSYPYYGVPVYGTGWYYPPYYGSVYYPRTPTWGLHVSYNPWTGWNYGVSWSNGFLSVGVSWGGGYHHHHNHCCGGGWYGGGYNRRPININTGDINIGNSVNIGNNNHFGNNNIGNNNRFGNNNLGSNNRGNNNNLYKRKENASRNAERPKTKATALARPATARKNDVFAGSDGTVAKHKGDKWQVREQNTWKADNAKQAAKDRSATNSIAKPATREHSNAGSGANHSVKRDTDRASSPISNRSANQSANRSNFDRSGFESARQSRQSGAARVQPVRGGGGGGGRHR